MPSNIDTFVDLFGGGFNVGINVSANKIQYNDQCFQVCHLLKAFKEETVQTSLSRIDSIIKEYSLSKENQEGFLRLRIDFNNHVKAGFYDIYKFYALICYAFNYQIRFNKSGEYNMPFGRNRSSFNNSLRDKLVKFIERLQEKNIFFTGEDFRNVNMSALDGSSFVYCDPPYLNTVAAYNESDGWTRKDEEDLRSLLCKLDKSNTLFGLSNNATYNTDLISWAESNGFCVYHINASYKNCNYQKARNINDDEVYITNYRECEI